MLKTLEKKADNFSLIKYVRLMLSLRFQQRLQGNCFHVQLL